MRGAEKDDDDGHDGPGKRWINDGWLEALKICLLQPRSWLVHRALWIAMRVDFRKKLLLIAARKVENSKWIIAITPHSGCPQRSLRQECGAEIAGRWRGPTSVKEQVVIQTQAGVGWLRPGQAASAERRRSIFHHLLHVNSTPERVLRGVVFGHGSGIGVSASRV